MNRCLSCFQPLGGTESGPWHRACARRVFGSEAVPSLDLNLDDLPQLGLAQLRQAGSVAGAQVKLSADRAAGPSGRLILQGPGGRWLLKPPAEEFPDLPANEAFCMELAARLGLPVAAHGLLPADGRLVYVTRRFDRGDAGEKIPQEDFCQLSGRLAADKYKGSLETAAKVLSFSGQRGLDASRFFDLNLFAWLSGNADMHLKNFSLGFCEGRWQLCPAYDLVSTVLALPEDQEETALTLNGRKHKLERGDWEHLALALGLPARYFAHRLKAWRAQQKLVEDLVQTSPLPEGAQGRFLDLWAERLAKLIPDSGA